MKRILLVLLALPVVLIIAGVVFILSIDPNSYKPYIQEELAKQGIQSEFNGDISWQFFPNVGLSLANIKLSDKQTDASLAELGSASFSVAVSPLLKREVKVNGITISQANIYYHVDKQGGSNWDALIENKQNETPDLNTDPQQSSNSEAPSIEIDSLAISGINLEYKDAQSLTHATLNQLSISAKRVNTDGQSFPLKLSFKTTMDNLPASSFNLSSQIAVDLNQQQLSLSDMLLTLVFADNTKASVTIETTSTQLSFGESLAFASESLLKIDDLRAVSQTFALPLPADLPDTAMNNLSFAVTAKGNSESLTLSTLRLALDKTLIQGNASVSDFSTPNITLKLAGDTINLDHYLPPSSDEEEAPESATPADEPSPLPLELIRSLTLDLTTSMESIVVKGIDMSQFQLKVLGKNGDIKVKPLSMNMAQGTFTSTIQLLAKTHSADLNFSAKAANINIGELIKPLTDTEILNGIIASDITGTSQGASSTALVENLNLLFDASSDQLRLNPINIEKSFCQAAALLEKKDLPPNDWPPFSDLSPIRLEAALKNQVVELKKMNANVQQLKASANGTFDIVSGQFDFPFNLSLAESASALEGCDMVNEKWRNRIIPLRCKASLDSIGPATCLPDLKRIGRLIEDQYKDEAKAKAKKKTKKLEKKAKEKLTEKLGEDKVKELKDGLKGLFKRN